MSLEIEIQQATLDDAPEVAAIKHTIWPDELVDVAQIAKAIQEPSHATHVGLHAHRIIGFIDGFSTYSAQGIHRWEADLLAVHPDYRGHRVGERLVRANTKAGDQRGAEVARGLIRTENIASQRTFARCAYQPDGPFCELYVFSKREHIQNEILFTRKVHAIPVTTLTYNGCWLEVDFSSDTQSGEYPIHVNNERLVVGVLIPIEEKEMSHSIQQAGFVKVGQFQWWILSLNKN
jgi:GNAT superfamily N-acetyltransferase